MPAKGIGDLASLFRVRILDKTLPLYCRRLTPKAAAGDVRDQKLLAI
jgi:hypothetical protein